MKQHNINCLFHWLKVFAIYFSAHWCPPCRGFTPKLAEWYTKDQHYPRDPDPEIGKNYWGQYNYVNDFLREMASGSGSLSWRPKDLKAKGLEVIFASSDRDEAGFADYYKESGGANNKYNHATVTL